MDKCIVCGCTQERACPNGCSWAVASPPVCDACVEVYLFAQLWGVVMELEAKAKAGSPARRDINWLRRAWSTLSQMSGPTPNSKGDKLVPSLRRVCQINRTLRKLEGRRAKR